MGEVAVRVSAASAYFERIGGCELVSQRAERNCLLLYAVCPAIRCGGALFDFQKGSPGEVYGERKL
jgi:hypothetical protein